MAEPERKGARNPKEVKLSFGITDGINDRLERLCDVAGMNKGSMAAAVLAAGLQTLESAFLGLNPEVMVAAARRYDQLQKNDLTESQKAVPPVSENVQSTAEDAGAVS
jgi:hypothetical protein